MPAKKKCLAKEVSVDDLQDLDCDDRRMLKQMKIKTHPDKNPGCKKDADDKFAILNAKCIDKDAANAHQLLENLRKRNSTAKEIKSQAKEFVKDLEPTFKFLALVKKGEQKEEKKIQKSLEVQKKEVNVVSNRLKRYIEKHGNSMLETAGGEQGPVSQQLSQIFDGTTFKSMGCRWRGGVSDKPVYLSLCHPLEKDTGQSKCKYRVCFDARNMLKKKVKGSTVNPLLQDADDARTMVPKVDDSFWDLLEIAVELSDSGIGNGMLQSKDAVDHTIVIGSVMKGVKRHIEKTKGYFAQYGQVWKNIKKNTLLKHIYGDEDDTQENILTKILRVPFYAFVLPLVSDIVKVIICFSVQGVNPLEALQIMASTIIDAFPASGIGNLMTGIAGSFSECLKTDSSFATFQALGAIYNCGFKPAGKFASAYLQGLYTGTASLIAEILKDYFPILGKYSSFVKKLEKEYTWFEFFRFDEKSRVYKKKTNLILESMPNTLQSFINTGEILSVLIISSIPVSISILILKFFFWLLNFLIKVLLSKILSEEDYKQIIQPVNKIYDLLMSDEFKETAKDSVEVINTLSLAFLQLGMQIKPLMNVFYVALDWLSMFGCILRKMFGMSLSKEQAEKGCCLGALIKGLKEIVPDKYATIKQVGAIGGGIAGVGAGLYGAAAYGSATLGLGALKLVGSAGSAGMGALKFVGSAASAIGAANTLYQNMITSDDRYKTKITRVSKHGKFNIYLYRMKTNPDHVFFGLSAQETRKVLPSAVHVGTDGILRIKLSKLPQDLKNHLIYMNSIDMKYARKSVVPKMIRSSSPPIRGGAKKKKKKTSNSQNTKPRPRKST